MFGISGEHLLILGIVLLIFGPRRLPELGNTLGKAIRNFKDSLSGVEEAKFTRLQEDAARNAAAHQAAMLQQAQQAAAAAHVSAPGTVASTTPPASTDTSGTSGSGSHDPNRSGNTPS